VTSPFFWRHFGILLLVFANFALSLFAAQRARASFSQSALTRSVLARAGSVAYLAGSTLILLLGVSMFIELELSEHAQSCWKTNRDWAKVKLGMTRRQVVQILGDPPANSFGNDQYSLHPFEYFGAYIFYDVTTEESAHGLRNDNSKVTEKQPAESVDWIPNGIHGAYQRQLASDAMPLCFLGLIVLAVASVIPMSLQAGANSWMLYLPLVAILFVVIYEWNVTAGWRFDLMLLYPIYLVILGAWSLRLWKVVKA
jgi:hypothetical protein